jgi:hypothetical protein
VSEYRGFVDGVAMDDGHGWLHADVQTGASHAPAARTWPSSPRVINAAVPKQLTWQPMKQNATPTHVSSRCMMATLAGMGSSSALRLRLRQRSWQRGELESRQVYGGEESDVVFMPSTASSW